MGTEIGREAGALISTVAQELLSTPVEFDFFQAVRILEAMHVLDTDALAQGFLGSDSRPETESVRFSAFQSLSFPPTEITRLEAAGSSERRSLEMEVAFFGLTGPNGALPHHYTSLVIDRRRRGDETMRHFYDLFNHRLVSLFYRAWRKYRLAFSYERYRHEHTLEDRRSEQRRLDRSEPRTTDTRARHELEVDDWTQSLLSICGFGLPGSRRRLLVDDEAFAFFSGHFGNQRRPAVALRSILSDSFGVLVAIEQFRGEWLALSEDSQSQLPSRGNPLGRNCALGHETLVGARVWSCQHRFRVIIGPVNWQKFIRLLPNEAEFISLCQITRTFVGIEFDFDVQVILRKEDVPGTVLGGLVGPTSRLGWTTWLPQRSTRADAKDAVFHHSGFPTSRGGAAC